MLKLFVLIATAEVCMGAPQFIIRSSSEPYHHPAILLNSAMEATLPGALKNDFYKNPNIAAGLAGESWLAGKETQVVNRDTDEISRDKIYNILRNAGFVRR